MAVVVVVVVMVAVAEAVVVSEGFQAKSLLAVPVEPGPDTLEGGLVKFFGWLSLFQGAEFWKMRSISLSLSDVGPDSSDLGDKAPGRGLVICRICDLSFAFSSGLVNFIEVDVVMLPVPGRSDFISALTASMPLCFF